MAETPRSTVRVLVVDDYVPFRRFVFSELGKSPELHIIGEASDGLEAIQKAEELQPDLIVLDIGLPKLNGIEAGKRIHEVAPGTKILFVTQNNDVDVVRAVLSNGASGYVLKPDASKELLQAVKAVLQGDRFVSARVNQCDGSPL
jgi:DNA-binding NarL/FixJ family response regulator